MHRKLLTLFTGLISMILVLSMIISCGGEPDAGDTGDKETVKPELKNPGTFIYATIGAWDSLDPAYAYDTASGEIIQAVYEPLISNWYTEDTSHYEPVLATEWTVSDDGKTYRFKIREGVKFHNGNDLTPEDVEYSFERGMVQDYGAGPQWMFFEPFFGTDTHSSRSDAGLIPLDEIKSKVLDLADNVDLVIVEHVPGYWRMVENYAHNPFSGRFRDNNYSLVWWTDGHKW